MTNQPSASPSYKPIHAVIFDYGKVLSLAPTAADWQRLAAAANMSVDRFQEPYWGFRDDYDRATLNAFDYWSKVVAVGGGKLDLAWQKRLTELDNQQWTIQNDGMVELSRRLRQAGIKTGILSNMQFDMLAAMRAKFPWLNEFDSQIYTCEIGVVKPDAEAYLHTCHALGCAPENTLFIDDKQPNIDGAVRAGLQAIRFDSPAAQPDVEELLSTRSDLTKQTMA